MSTHGSRSRDSLSLPLMVESPSGGTSRDGRVGRPTPRFVRDDLDGDELDTPMLSHHRRRGGDGSSMDDVSLGMGAAADRHASVTDIRKMWYDTAHAHSHVHKMSDAEKDRMKGYESLDYDTVQNLVYQVREGRGA